MPADFVKAQSIVLGSLAADSPKGVRMRLALDLLGLPYKYISGYRSGGAAKLAIERGEINFFGESPPSYFIHRRAGNGEDRHRDPGLSGLLASTARNSSCRTR